MISWSDDESYNLRVSICELEVSLSAGCTSSVRLSIVFLSLNPSAILLPLDDWMPMGGVHILINQSNEVQGNDSKWQ
jgi:hypothetical protein